MASMTIRATYAFDPETAKTITELAEKWGVSQSEAVRRSVRIAKEQEANATKRTPYEILLEMFENPMATAEEVERYQKEASEIRKSWRDPSE
jgi:hypothetical protein